MIARASECNSVHWKFWPKALGSVLSDCQLFTFLYFNSHHWINALNILYTDREMRMDLNRKTLVSHKYCCRVFRLWTYKFTDCIAGTKEWNLFTIICTTGYWKKLGGAILEAESWFYCLLCGQCSLCVKRNQSNSRLSFVSCASPHHCKYLISICQLNKHST